MYMPVLFIHLSIDGHLGCICFLAVMNSTAVNIHVQVFAGVPVSVLLGIRPRMKLLDHMLILVKVFEEVKTVPQTLHRFNISISNV